MKETHQFLVPDYYTDFKCKMGTCRSACCEGWPISVSMQNYFRLLGIDCKKELRERLDCGLRVIDYPTEDEYARFEPRYDGNCPLRMADGRCALHAELGEDILPDVCRLYPRGIRVEGDIYEASCANSCEAVLEMLFQKHDPIVFEKRKLSIAMPPAYQRESFFITFSQEQQIRLYLIGVIQDRNRRLPERIYRLGKILDKMDVAMENGDVNILNSVLSEPSSICEISKNDISEEHMMFGIDIAEKMTEIFDARSQSIKEYGEKALSCFGKNEETLGKYKTAAQIFEKKFPDWEIFFENMLVNHMFFSMFPFQDRPENMHSEFTALCAVYILLRFLALGCITAESSESELIDVMGAAFRLIDHTEFDRYASYLLQKLDCTNEEKLRDLLSL